MSLDEARTFLRGVAIVGLVGGIASYLYGGPGLFGTYVDSLIPVIVVLSLLSIPVYREGS